MIKEIQSVTQTLDGENPIISSQSNFTKNDVIICFSRATHFVIPPHENYIVRMRAELFLCTLGVGEKN